MKQLTSSLLLFFVFALFSACSDDDNTEQFLNGTFTETSPINGRSQLIFIGEDTVIKKELDSSVEDEFAYEITENKIKLSPKNTNHSPQEFEIRIINSSKFEIENLYPSVGINPTTFIIFEK